MVKKVLCGVTFSIDKGETFGIIGVNGADKQPPFNVLKKYVARTLVR